MKNVEIMQSERHKKNKMKNADKKNAIRIVIKITLIGGQIMSDEEFFKKLNSLPRPVRILIGLPLRIALIVIVPLIILQLLQIANDVSNNDFENLIVNSPLGQLWLGLSVAVLITIFMWISNQKNHDEIKKLLEKYNKNKETDEK